MAEQLVAGGAFPARRAVASRHAPSTAPTAERAMRSPAPVASSHHSRTRATSSWPHSVGVTKARWATMSATDWSPVCPMPVHTGTPRVAMARATGSASKAARSPRDPPPRTRTTRSRADSATARKALAIDGGAPGSLDVDSEQDDGEGQPRSLQLTDEVVVALRSGARHQADPKGHFRQRKPVVAT